VTASVEAAFHAFVDPDVRRRWLPDAELAGLAERGATPPRKARFDVSDGTRISVEIQPGTGAGRCLVAVEHQRLPDADAASARRAYWRDRLEALKVLLEG
jgi:uncharacterized protein YndB with AHSA1/START domain